MLLFHKQENMWYRQEKLLVSKIICFTDRKSCWLINNMFY
jgi:hypothetical protein